MLRIKELRKAHGLSQQELANTIGVTQATLSGWENEKYEIDNKSLLKCANYFCVTVDYLLGRDTETYSIKHPKCVRMSTGDLIHYLRKVYLATTFDISKLTNISCARLEDIEADHTELTPRELNSIAKLYNADDVSEDMIKTGTIPETIFFDLLEKRRKNQDEYDTKRIGAKEQHETNNSSYRLQALYRNLNDFGKCRAYEYIQLLSKDEQYTSEVPTDLKEKTESQTA